VPTAEQRKEQRKRTEKENREREQRKRTEKENREREQRKRTEKENREREQRKRPRHTRAAPMDTLTGLTTAKPNVNCADKIKW
jgi:hypothetical protein